MPDRAPEPIRAAGKPRRVALTPIRLGAGPLRIRAADDAAAGKLPTFSMLAYTGAVMRLDGYYDPVIVDLAGVRRPAGPLPVYRQHDPCKLVGHTSAVEIGPDGITAAGVVSAATADAAEVVQSSRNGFPWQASIGADPVRNEFLEPGATATVNGREVTGPLVICRESTLSEISVVPRGADDSTSTTVAASRRRLQGGKRMNFEQWLMGKGYTAGDNVDMGDDVKAALERVYKGEGVSDAKAEDGDGDADKADKAEDKDADVDVNVDAADDEADEADEDGKPAKAKAKAGAASKFKAARRAEAAELRRVSSIKARLAKYGDTTRVKLADGRTVDLIPHAIEAGWSADRAELAAVRASRPGPDVGGPLVYSTGKPEITEAVLEAAVLQAGRCELFDADFYTKRGLSGPHVARLRAEVAGRYTDQAQQHAHTAFRGNIGLQQLLTHVAAANGYRGSEVIRDDATLGAVAAACMRPIRADGASTANIANVLANVQNKFLGQGYLYTEQAWRDVCAIRSVKDFKPTKTVNLFGGFEFDPVGPSGELKHADLQDQAFANQASTVGKMISISRQQIINDDLGALTDVPKLLGRGAGLRLNRTFWALWLNPGKDEGGVTDFWATTHTVANQTGTTNYIEGAATTLSSNGLNTAATTFDKMVDPKGYPLGVEPRILLYPPELEVPAWELLNSQFIVYGGASASKQPANNRFAGKYRPVMSRYLSNSAFTGNSATAWWLLADPNEISAIEACFLGGVELPTVQTAGPDFQFNVLGISMRGFFDFGVNMQNYRGGVKSKGAA